MKIEIGKIVKAQGINGEVKLACFVDDACLVKNVATCYIQGRAYEVQRIRGEGNFFFAKFVGVDTRNDAEELRDLVVYAEKDQVLLPENRYFIDDLVGCILTIDDKNIGTVTDVLQYGAADVFVCDGVDGNNFSFPFLKDVVASVDVENKAITVNGKRFGEVVVYED